MGSVWNDWLGYILLFAGTLSLNIVILNRGQWMGLFRLHILSVSWNGPWIIELNEHGKWPKYISYIWVNHIQGLISYNCIHTPNSILCLNHILKMHVFMFANQVVHHKCMSPIKKQMWQPRKNIWIKMRDVVYNVLGCDPFSRFEIITKLIKFFINTLNTVSIFIEHCYTNNIFLIAHKSHHFSKWDENSVHYSIMLCCPPGAPFTNMV